MSYVELSAEFQFRRVVGRLLLQLIFDLLSWFASAAGESDRGLTTLLIYSDERQRCPRCRVGTAHQTQGILVGNAHPTGLSIGRCHAGCRPDQAERSSGKTAMPEHRRFAPRSGLLQLHDIHR